MKGADSAMPVWADFMQEALRTHPEWNGDWAMPANVRKAEIDIRNGALIRELDAVEPSPTTDAYHYADASKGPNLEQYYEEPPLEPKDIYVTDVPAEFRRIEIFVVGTVPNRSLLPVPDENPVPSGSARVPPRPRPPTQVRNKGDTPTKKKPTSGSNPTAQTGGTVTVMICPLTGMRATINCPNKESKSFRAGTEPKEFCTGSQIKPYQPRKAQKNEKNMLSFSYLFANFAVNAYSASATAATTTASLALDAFFGTGF